MKNAAILVLTAALTASAAGASAQPTYMRGADPSSEPQKKDEPAAPRPRPRRRARTAAGAPMGGDKAAIEAYLQSRLNKINRMYRVQEAFGRKMSAAWDQYWGKVFSDRKRFEVRIARNRLDLFESLGSLDSGAHNSNIADYERLQTNLWKSFEDKQKEEMAQFFSKMIGDLKDFSAEQEKGRQDFMSEATDAWQAQKAAAPAGR